jgi:hypothetical protein
MGEDVMRRDAEKALSKFYRDCKKGRSDVGLVKASLTWMGRAVTYASIGAVAAGVLVAVCSSIPVSQNFSPVSPLFRKAEYQMVLQEMQPPRRSEREESRCNA